MSVRTERLFVMMEDASHGACCLEQQFLQHLVFNKVNSALFNLRTEGLNSVVSWPALTLKIALDQQFSTQLPLFD